MRLLGYIYNQKLVSEHYGTGFKVNVIKVPGKNLGIGNLRIIAVKENNSEIELVLAYEDYTKWQNHK